jgi:hypothetical protein
MPRVKSASGKTVGAGFDIAALTKLLEQLAADVPEVVSLIAALLSVFGGGSLTPHAVKASLAAVKDHCNKDCHEHCCKALHAQLEALQHQLCCCCCCCGPDEDPCNGKKVG